MARPDRTTFEHLVHTCHAAVFRAARRLLADDAAAADVTQEVFLRVWTGKVRLDDAVEPRAVLLWLAVRQAANTSRARRRRDHHEEHVMHRDLARPADPAATSELHDLHTYIAREVDALPAELRVPLLLHHQDDLPLSAVGSALALPTSTVHDRIQRGLERLRARLQQHGRGLAQAVLPELLGRLEPATSPSGLENRLMALPSAAPVMASLPKLAFATLAMGVLTVGGIVAAGDLFGHEPTSLRTAAIAERMPQDPSPSRPPAPQPDRNTARTPVETAQQSPPSPAATPWQTTFTGSVRDAGGFPVVGAQVSVVAGGGYKAFELGGATTTDARGAFSVVANGGWLQPDHVRLSVYENGRRLLDTGDLAARRRPDAPPLDLVLPPTVAPASERFELSVLVRDAGGAPLPGANAALYAGSLGAPSLHWATSVEVAATVGRDGRASLRSRGLGKRWLLVDGRPLGRDSVLLPIELPRAGDHATEVELPPGGNLAVEVAAVPGHSLNFGEPWLEHEATGLWLQPVRDGDHWRFRGLAAGPYTVRYADAAVRGVTAERGRVTITAKDPHDTRDHGDHLAELHGELVDAVTGAVVAYDPFDVDVHPVLADGSSWVADGIEPPRPAQRAMEGGERKEFHYTGLSPGRWAIVASVDGYAVACQVFDLRERQLRSGLRIALQRPATVRGKVVDAGGQPVRGATVLALGTGPLADRHVAAWRARRDRSQDPGAAEPSFTALRAWTSDAGAFRMAKVPPDTSLRLVALHDDGGFVDLALPPMRSGEVVPEVVLRLQPR